MLLAPGSGKTVQIRRYPPRFEDLVLGPMMLLTKVKKFRISGKLLALKSDRIDFA